MIETKRLQIIPLLYEQLLMYVMGDPSLEKELNIKSGIPPFSKELKESLEHSIIPQTANPKNNYQFFTLWAIVLKENRIPVGDLHFKGGPDDKGAVEIGYGTYSPYQKKGYMTEAVEGIINWIKAQQSVNTIIAEVEQSNTASSKVLEKNHFILSSIKWNFFYWRRSTKA